MSERFKTSFRGYLIDHRSPAPPTVDLKNLKIADYAAFFETAELTTLMVYTKDHWGYSYYDTRIGHRHPSLTLDFVGEVAPLVVADGKIQLPPVTQHQIAVLDLKAE